MKTTIITVAIIFTIFVWIIDLVEDPNKSGYFGGLFGALGCFTTCFIWMIALGLLLLLRGCGS